MSDGMWFLEGVENIVRLIGQQRENIIAEHERHGWEDGDMRRSGEYDPELTERIVKHILDLAKWRAEELVAKETHRLEQKITDLERRVLDLELEV